jgi:hypothetical protein
MFRNVKVTETCLRISAVRWREEVGVQLAWPLSPKALVPGCDPVGEVAPKAQQKRLRPRVTFGSVT